MNATAIASDATSDRRSAPERRALAAKITHESWRRDPHFRRKQLTVGHVRALLRLHPDDLTDVLVAAVHAATEGTS